MQSSLLNSSENLLKYSSNINLKNVDIEGQERINQAKIAIVGCGGLGSSVAKILCSNGIGHLYVWDDDKISVSNLARQIVFDENQINQLKTTALKKKLNEQNSDTQVVEYRQKLNLEVMQKHLAEFKDMNLILDCTDSWESRQEINQFCSQNNLKWLHAAVIKNSGQVALIDTNSENACYQCIYPKPLKQESCSFLGLSSAIVNIIASIQANECIHYLLNQATLQNKLLFMDLNNYNLTKYNLVKKTDCTVCN